MLNYLVRRLLMLVPMLLGISVAVFLILYLIPGDPARLAAGPDAAEEDVAQIRANYGLDQPAHIQYLTYLNHLLRGDLGQSFRTGRPVIEEVARTLPATVELAATAMLLAVVLGVPIGIYSSLHPRTLVDSLVTTLSVFGISMPGFFLGLLLMLLFSSTLMWLPPTGRGSLAHLVLPSVTLGLPYVATFARLTRSNMLEVLSEDYVRTARAKGLARGLVIYKHALINASVPLVTMLGIHFGRLLGGAVIAETVFAWPGMGRYMIEAIIMRDIYVVQGTLLVFAASVVIVNLVVDVIYGLLDPRITYS